MKNTNKLIIIIASVICVAVIAATTVAISVINKNNNQTPTDPQSENESQTTTVQAKIENLQASDSDIDDLMELLDNIWTAGYSFEFSNTETDAYQHVLETIFGYIGDAPLYQYIYNKEPVYFYATDSNFNLSESDPLNKLTNTYGYAKLPADEVDRIIRNIYSITPNRDKATLTYDGECYAYYYDNYYYFSCGGGEEVSATPKLENYTVSSDNIYTVDYILKMNDYGETYDGNKFRAVCALKMIDGKEQWTISQIKQIA